MASNIIEDTKRCSSCDCVFPLSSFGLCASYKGGRRGQCNICRSRAQTAYIQKNPTKRTAQKPDAVRRAKWKQKYGLSESRFLEILDSQGGGCAICKTVPAIGEVLHVDHCHETGVVRGLLCRGCNVSLGRVGDNLAGVMRFVLYLELAALNANNSTA